MSKLLSTAVNPLYQDGRLIDAGITKREYIASAALAGMLGNSTAKWEIEATIEDAVKFADALLAELAKEVSK